MYVVRESTCDGCGTCAGVCPADAIKVIDGKAQINYDECLECGACQGECPNEAIYET